MTSKANLHQQLKQALIKQKTSHLEPPDEQSQLYLLYKLLYQYDEHISKLVFQALQGKGEFIPFPATDALQEEFKSSASDPNSEIQRLLQQYHLHKARLDEIYQLVKAILTTNKNGEYSNGG